MIFLNFRIQNPFHNDWAKLRDWFWWDRKLTKHKNFEIQLGHFHNLPTLFSFEVDTRWRGHDHAGPSFDLTILWFYVMVKIYDNRHWDYSENKWEVYDEIDITKK
jgi:hypothetical protein